MKRLFAGLMLLIPSVLFGQSSDEADIANRGFSPDLSAYISPSLDPAEQVFMRSYMNQLAPDTKMRILNMTPENVSIAIVDGAAGIIHYNHPEDAGAFEVQESAALPGAKRPSANDEISETEFVANNPGVFGGSGPYRRIYTLPVPAIGPPPRTRGMKIGEPTQSAAG